MGYCHKKSYQTRWTDFDFRDELKLSCLLSFAQEAAGSSADEIGFGYYDLLPKKLGFLIVSTECKIFRPVKPGEPLTVETWPLPPRHVIFERHYRIGSGEETVAALASRWCLVDLNTFSLCTPDVLGEVHERCPYNPEKILDVKNWKIPKLAGTGEEVYRMRVGVSQCDHYLHANNTRYLDFFLDCFSMDELARRRIASFRICYAKQAKEGSELTLFRRDEGETSILEAWAEGELLTQCLIQFEQKESL